MRGSRATFRVGDQLTLHLRAQAVKVFPGESPAVWRGSIPL